MNMCSTCNARAVTFVTFFLPFFCLQTYLFLPIIRPLYVLPIILMYLFFAFGFTFILPFTFLSTFLPPLHFALCIAFTFSIYLYFAFILPYF